MSVEHVLDIVAISLMCVQLVILGVMTWLVFKQCKE